MKRGRRALLTGLACAGVAGLVAWIGEEAYPAVLTALEDPRASHFSVPLCIVVMHKRRGVDISRAVPALLLDAHADEAYVEANPRVDIEFSFSVRDIRDDLGFFMPALTNCLGHSNCVVRAEAASFLGACGPEVRAAVPALVRVLNDGDTTVRAEATNALREIADIEQRTVNSEQ